MVSWVALFSDASYYVGLRCSLVRFLDELFNDPNVVDPTFVGELRPFLEVPEKVRCVATRKPKSGLMKLKKKRPVLFFAFVRRRFACGFGPPFIDMSNLEMVVASGTKPWCVRTV